MTTALAQSDSGAILKRNGKLIGYAGVCCSPCSIFLREYNSASHPTLEVDPGTGGNPLFGIATATFSYGSFAAATCTGNSFIHSFSIQIGFAYVAHLYIGGQLGGTASTNRPIISADISYNSGFGQPQSVYYRILGCNAVIQAIEDLFNGFDVILPVTFSTYGASNGVLRLA